MSYQNKRGLIIGLGLSGRAAAQFLLKRGADLAGVDRQAATLLSHPEIVKLQEKGLRIFSENEIDLTGFHFVVLSPGVPPSHPLFQQAVKNGLEVMGEIELGCRALSHSVIGITGTNGKTTVTFLVDHVLNKCGKKAKALGNIGVPLTQEIDQLENESHIVLELSSFQLETLSKQVLDAAVILNITPDHLDRYQNMEKYAEAKCRIQHCLKPGKRLYVESQTFLHYQHLFKADVVYTYGYASDCAIFTDLQSLYCQGKKEGALPASLQGKKSHDLENFMAAFALCQTDGVTFKEFFDAFDSFKKPAHRIEFVIEKRGIRYYDDSKGTNIDAVKRAVQTVPSPIILIAGGVDKGAPYTSWLEDFEGKVKMVFAIGQAAHKIADEISHKIPVTLCGHLEQAVKEATKASQKGDTILLSPGCSSYDMFRDYAHRGEEFQRIVHAL